MLHWESSLVAYVLLSMHLPCVPLNPHKASV